MKNHTCLLDHHQSSHYDTITIGPEGMMNWVLQLNNSQSVNSFNSLLEKFHVLVKLSEPTQSKPKPICDRSVKPINGKHAWQQEEEQIGDISTALSVSELFKAIQDAILLILLYRTMLLFRATSSTSLIMSDVQSICIPSAIQD